MGEIWADAVTLHEKIDAQANQAKEQIGKLAQQAREEIEAKVAFSIRSIAQRRRWRNFQEFNRRKSK